MACENEGVFGVGTAAWPTALPLGNEEKYHSVLESEKVRDKICRVAEALERKTSTWTCGAVNVTNEEKNLGVDRISIGAMQRAPELRTLYLGPFV